MTTNNIKLIRLFFAAVLVIVIVIVINWLPQKQYKEQIIQTPETIQKPQITTTTLFLAGDIMLSRNVEDRMAKAQDYTLPFKQIADISHAADIAFANLESPFNDQGRHFVPNSLVFNANPKSVEGLTLAGFDVLSTANNHSLDQGQKGIAYTADLLKKNNIIPVGTGTPKVDVTMSTIEKNKLVFGFLAYSYTAYNDGGKSTSPMIGDFNDTAQMKQDILTLKGHYSDIVIVSMHAGTEYTRTPNQAQMDFAHAAIDAGADMVIGHHPHWIQITEIYKDKPIFYSLGNFVFDQMWSQDTREGLTALVTYENNEIKKIELKPVVIENFCCVRWANEKESLKILNKIGLTSAILIDKND